MEKIRLIIANHYRIIFFALLIGFISSVPQYLGQPSRPGFQGIYTGVVKDTIFYQARVKDVIDGYPFVANPYLYEHKSGAPMQFWIPDYILAKPIQWLGISVPQGYILWAFILPFILAILSYSILLILTRSEKLSILGTLVLHMGFFALKFIRLPPHGLNFVFWLTALLFLLLFITKGEKKHAFGSALSFGMLFNIYPYYWTFYVVLFATFIFLSFIVRLQGISYRKYLLIFIGGLAVGIPYFVSLYQSSQLAGYSESISRLGVIHTHFPSGISTVIIGAAVALAFIWVYKRRVVALNPLSLFLFSGTLAAVIVMNQHLITGKNAEFSSHYMVGNMFWFSFAFLYIITEWLKGRSGKIRKTAFILFCVFTAIISFRGGNKLINQQITYRESEPYLQNYRPVFEWLNENAKSDEVVYANEEISAFIPIYTAQNIFFTGYSILFFMTNDEVESRFVINHYFDTFTDDYVRSSQRSIFGGYYVNEYGHSLSKNKLRKLFGIEPVAYQLVPDHEVERIQTLAEGIQKQDFEMVIKRYKADYLVWDSLKDPQWNVNDSDFLEQLFSDNGIFIYRIR